MPLPDLFLLCGDDAKDMLRRSGVPEERLIVVGARRFDDLEECRRRRREEFSGLRRRWPIGSDTRIVLIATNYFADLSRALLGTCVDALADRPETLVLVKPHPNHRTVEEDLRLPAGAQARFVVTNEDLNLLQAAADVMIGGFGTADAEAVAIGCPVIKLALADFDLSPTSDHADTTLQVASAGELRRAIDGVLAGGARAKGIDRFVERVFFRLDGQSGARILEALRACETGGHSTDRVESVVETAIAR